MAWISVVRSYNAGIIISNYVCIMNQTIQFSPAKTIFSIAGSILFVIIGCWILVYQPDSGRFFNSPVVKMVVGLGSILFFGFIAVLSVKRLVSKNKDAVIITDLGITDQASPAAVGFIPWTDITGVMKVKVFTQEFVVLMLRNPQQYVDGLQTVLARRAASYNYKKCGSPVCLSATALAVKTDELESKLRSALAAYKATLREIPLS